MIDWLIANKEWVFSGIGVALVSIAFGFFSKKKKESESYETTLINDGNHNIQIGGSVKITQRDGDAK